MLRSFNPPITDWRGQRVWVLGASSGIGLATAEALIARGASVQVSARGAAALERLVAQHTRTGEPPTAQAWPLDVTDASAVAATARAILAQGPLDLVVYCAGHYREMRATDFDLGEMNQHLAINYTGALNVLDAVLPAFIARGAGHLSLISSVAGFRGLPKSLAYGPTKAALTNLAETLYLDLEPLGLGVSVVHPGFVQTPLTAQNSFTMPALITPEQAAVAMLDGWAAGDFDIHYPKRFTRWMKLLRLLPYRAYFPAVRRFTGL
ncbi:MAG: SDR family NAD(P)-dependent oxidoreductase [Hydrogenophaga sp.]|uniref:SDR family NAD(P)-dependent oxidoreductase n=1 Tax=Hydrogenophaga sp. TaxID=1904254 RepID=UPI0025B9B79E|nr:SDR family NAD(P)-dependent oxidoreductase [Hydrogenophaga sp.]MBT9552580.1 SDR family NAD(P)-dependent oxidoreductase [Hydrogenophaga sp.]